MSEFFSELSDSERKMILETKIDLLVQKDEPVLRSY